MQEAKILLLIAVWRAINGSLVLLLTPALGGGGKGLEMGMGKGMGMGQGLVTEARGGLAARGCHCVPSCHLSCPLCCQEHRPCRAAAAEPGAAFPGSPLLSTAPPASGSSLWSSWVSGGGRAVMNGLWLSCAGDTCPGTMDSFQPPQAGPRLVNAP